MIVEYFKINNYNIEWFTLIFFFVLLTLELLFFFNLDKQVKLNSRKPINYINILTFSFNIIYLILGFFQFFIFWLTVAFLYTSIWFLWLKFKYCEKYDIKQLTDVCFLIIFVFLASLLTFRLPLILILSLYTFFFIFSFWQFPRYLYKKKRAIIYRNKAIEALENKKYSEAWQFLVNGIYYASTMVATLMGYVKSAIQVKMEKEINTIQNYLNHEEIKKKSDLFNIIDLIKIPKISKKELTKHTIIFIIISITLLVPLSFLIISI
jgi:hypothetical protein